MKLTISRGDYLTLRIMLALFVVAPLVSPFWHAWAWTKGDPLVLAQWGQSLAGRLGRGGLSPRNRKWADRAPKP